MATTVSVENYQLGDFRVAKLTVTWDNSDLDAPATVHGLAKGVTPTVLGTYQTTAGTNIGTFTYEFDNDEGDVTITAKQETSGTIANLVSVHTFLGMASADQDGTSIP